MAIAAAWILGSRLLGPPEDRLDDALTLEWEAPAECPTSEQVRRRVALAIPPGEAPSRRVHATGRIEEDGERWRLALTIETAEGTSSPGAEAGDCETLVDAAVVQVSMALEVQEDEGDGDGDGVSDDGDHDHDHGHDHDAEGEDEGLSVSEPLEVRGVFGFGGGVGFGVVPRVDGWLAVNGGVRIGLGSGRIESAARVEVFLGHAFSQLQAIATDDDAGVAVSAWWIGPRGCWEPIVGTWSFPLCGGPDLAIVDGRGVGVVQARRARRLWLGVAGGGSAQWHPVPRVGVRLGVESFVTVLRPSFTVDRLDAVYRVGPAGLRALVALQIVLP